MGRNSHYFKNREERANHARLIIEENERMRKDAIQYSIDHTDIYYGECEVSGEGCITVPGRFKTQRSWCDLPMYLVDTDSVSALFSMDRILQYGEPRRSPLILNFASYKNPGGKFLDGSSAQEESLCHESTLYNVLSSPPIMEDYYEQNRKNTNDHLYRSNAVITPQIMFMREIEGKTHVEYADVLTCAAPNAYAASRAGVTDKKIKETLRNRIFNVLHDAFLQYSDVLILGAYGCGVFGNNPYDVATFFKEFLQKYFDEFFSAVIFAIPSGGESNKNYQAFDEVINGYKKGEKQ